MRKQDDPESQLDGFLDSAFLALGKLTLFLCTM
jgi:hypothetical protein